MNPFHVPAHKQLDAKPAYDFLFENEGSICLLTPASPAAIDWVAEHIPLDAQTWGNAIVIEPRYVGPIIKGIQSEGLEVAA